MEPAGYGFEQNPQGGRSMHDYLRWLIRGFWIFLLCLIGGYLLGVYLHSITPRSYRSVATIEILRVKQEAAEVDEEEKINRSGNEELMSASERLKMPRLYENIAEAEGFSERQNIIPAQMRLPWAEPPAAGGSAISAASLGQMMKDWVTLTWRRDTTMLDIFVTHTDPEIAHDTLAALLREYEKATLNRVADSSENALDYILASSGDVKEKMLGLEKAIRLYNRCSELSDEVRASEREIAEMEKRYLPGWPALVEAKELSKILKDKFSQELEQVLRLSEDEQKFWASNQPLLSGLPHDELINSQIQLVSTRSSVLTRELEAEQQIYDNLITKLKEGNLSKGFRSKQFDIAQAPTVPTHPISPVKQKMLATYTLGGAALGIGLILVIGFFDSTVRTVGELEQLTGLSVVGAIADAKTSLSRDGVLVLSRDPNSTVSEEIRMLRGGLTFLGDREERKSFLITSAVPGEGKSWVAANLAQSFAMQGDRTLLIDADLRRPVQSQVFGYESATEGLADLLAGQATLNDVIRGAEDVEGLYLLPAGSRSANPSELLAGKNLAPLFEVLNKNFDRIIVDSAPLVPVSDTLPIAKLVQSVVLITRVAKTPKGAIKRAIKILNLNGSDPIGVIANGLPKTRTKGAYGYYYSYNSGGGYSNYSSEPGAS